MSKHWERGATFARMWQEKNNNKRGILKMASLIKIEQSAIVNILRHNNRDILDNANEDIQIEESIHNYNLMEREVSPYQYYLNRKKELYCFNRKDVKTLAEWVVTVPKTVPEKFHKLFFEKTTEFLNEKYGDKNCVNASVHMDEKTPHLHYDFIPVVNDLKHGGEKICANAILTREELRNFHPGLKKYLENAGIPGAAGIHSGITVEQGGNRTVRDMKLERQHEKKFSWSNYNREHGRDRTYER